MGRHNDNGENYRMIVEDKRPLTNFLSSALKRERKIQQPPRLISEHIMTTAIAVLGCLCKTH